MTDKLPFRRAEHAGVIDDDAIDVADALMGVEEDDEEYHSDAEGDFRPDAESEPEQKNRREDDARQGVDDANIGVEQRAEFRRSGEGESENHAGGRAENERQQRFFHRGDEMRPDGAGTEPLHNACSDIAGAAEEKLVEFSGVDQLLPGTQDRRAERDLPRDASYRSRA